MLYELRIYDIPPGKMKDINDRFANHTTRIWKKYDIRPIAFWETVIGASNTLTYILVWESLAEREQKWNAFTTDPEWQKIAAETTKNGPIVLKVTNMIMRPTTYSALQ